MKKERVESGRTNTGIPGLDDLVEGGFPRNRIILVSGACGTGKSIFGMQFLYNGIVKYNEPGVFVSFDEMPQKIREDMNKFGWNLKELEKNEQLVLFDASSARAGAPSEEEHALMPGELDFEKIMVDLMSVCRRIGAKRIVVDSIPAMGLHIGEENHVRRDILKMSYILGHAGLTTILTTEIPEQEGRATQYSKYGVEEYISDGVILLGLLGSGMGVGRTIYVRKMRGTAHSTAIHQMDLNNKGITVKKSENFLK